MIIPRWRKIDRRRKLTIKYSDPEFNVYYDLDTEDFQNLVMKLKNSDILTEEENNRYGIWILTICMIVQEHSKFKNKPVWEREEMIEQQYLELLSGITTFNPDKGKIYSYAYRIAYTAAVHYYTNKATEVEKQNIIIEHCMDELKDYLEEYNDHKTKRH
jgi:hypothetical protein